jgi:hypothetical protein
MVVEVGVDAAAAAACRCSGVPRSLANPLTKVTSSSG